MEKPKKKDRLKTAIIVLATLLGISLVILAGMLLYKHLTPSEPVSVIVPDNIITPGTESKEEEQTTDGETTENKDEAENSVEEEQSSEVADEESSENTQSPSSSGNANANSNTNADRTATAISLHKRNAGVNVAFNTRDMLPGDTDTMYFCVRVSFENTVTVKYHADIRPGYEKLAEVLKCRIVLLTTGEVLYDGRMQELPESLNHSLYSAEGTARDLYYEITAYLDTDVGNEYQHKTLIADFRWWVEEESQLIDVPKTGDDFHIVLWAGLSCVSLFMLILLFIKRKKEAQNEQQ